MCAPALQELMATPIAISIATIIENFFILYVFIVEIKNCAAIVFAQFRLPKVS
jgi:hypothetical protein